MGRLGAHLVGGRLPAPPSLRQSTDRWNDAGLSAIWRWACGRACWTTWASSRRWRGRHGFPAVQRAGGPARGRRPRTSRIRTARASIAWCRRRSRTARAFNHVDMRSGEAAIAWKRCATTASASRVHDHRGRPDRNRERVKEMRGTVTIERDPAGGTVLRGQFAGRGV